MMTVMYCRPDKMGRGARSVVVPVDKWRNHARKSQLHEIGSDVGSNRK